MSEPVGTEASSNSEKDRVAADIRGRSDNGKPLQPATMAAKCQPLRLNSLLKPQPASAGLCGQPLNTPEYAPCFCPSAVHDHPHCHQWFWPHRPLRAACAV